MTEQEEIKEEIVEEAFEEIIKETGDKGLLSATDEQLIKLADWADWLGWAILAVGFVNFTAGMYIYFSQYLPVPDWSWARVVYEIILPILSELDSLLIAGFAYLVLQALMEIIYLMTDLRDISQPEETVEAAAEGQ